MNSRDRLRSGDLRSNIEEQLSDLIRNHPGLKELRERRRREDIENKLEDSKPLADVIETILQKSPTLSNLFLNGVRLPNPFSVIKAKSQDEYSGKRFPSYFKLIKAFDENNPKKSPINTRARIQYKTDVENDYFYRDSDPGNFILKLNGENIKNFSVNLWNGIATLNIELPEFSKPGMLLNFQSEVNDISRVEPIIEGFFILVEDKIKKTSGKPGDRKPPSSEQEGDDIEKTSYLDLPNVIEVYQDEWERYEFDRNSSLKVIDSGEDVYDFFVNMDNIHLLTEKKFNTKIADKLLDARYKYGMVLLGIALLNDYKNSQNNPQNVDDLDESNIYDKIIYVSKAISPILLPLIAGLGDLHEEEIDVLPEDD